MKGPGLKIKHDVRRVWKCPQTGKILKTPGHVTQFLSPFTKEPCWMQYVEEKRPSRRQIPLDELLDHLYISTSAKEAEQKTEEEEENAEAESKNEQADVESGENESGEEKADKAPQD